MFKPGDVSAPVPSEMPGRAGTWPQKHAPSPKPATSPNGLSLKDAFVLFLIAVDAAIGFAPISRPSSAPSPTVLPNTLVAQPVSISTPPPQASALALPSLAQTLPVLAPLPPLKCETPKQLTSGISTDLYPRWSPDGKNIAFHSTRMGTHNIWVISSEGGTPKQLTATGRHDGFPSWSPDGKRIVFVRFTGAIEDAFGELYTMNADAGNQTQLTSDGTAKVNVTWSPDGKSIAYSDIGTRAKPEGVIWVMDIETKERKKLADFGAGGLSYDPGGTRLVFDATNPQLQRWLYVMDVQDKVTTPLVKDMDRPSFPHWSPDGNWIAFYAGVGGMDGIWVVRPDGTGRNRLVVSREAIFPAWSPDGKTIAFTQRQNANAHVWTCDVQATQVPTSTKASESVLPKSPSSPGVIHTRSPISTPTAIEAHR